MKGFHLFLCVFFISLYAEAQKVIVVDALPANTPAEATVYLAGEINSWNPGDEAYTFAEVGEYLQFTLPESTPQIFEGKLTRGSWASAEGSEGGGYIPNRIFNFSTTDTIHITVLSWEDLGGSASDLPPNVVTLSADFYMPQLDRNRRVRLFLPSEYETSTADYPVLYMHDGQNLFSAQEAFAGEWEVDEALLAFEDAGYSGAIVVAIDNGGSYRIGEYTPWANPQYGGGDGEAYMEFVVNTLKPYVDENYRTLSDRENTGIMGSSLGGLISHYGALAYQNVFSKVGVFSPSFWFTDDIYSFSYSTGHQANMRMYFLAGGNESASLEGDVISMMDTLESAGFNESEMQFKFVPDGEHSEWFWAQEFPDAFEWLYLSSVTAINNVEPDVEVTLFPNPIGDTLNFTLPRKAENTNVEIFDTLGRSVLVFAGEENHIDVSSLSKGTYVVKIHFDNVTETHNIIKL